MAEFFYSTCKTAGLDSVVVLRNTPRNHCNDTELKPLEVFASIYQNGKSILKLRLEDIQPGRFLEVKESYLRDKLKLSTQDTSELLISFSVNKIGSKVGDFFPQEHQINYFSDNPPGFCSVLFDQLPLFEQPRPPIILLAPKIWLNQETEVYLVVSNRTNPSHGINSRLQFGVFSFDGECIAEWEETETTNSARVYPLHHIFKTTIPEDKTQNFYNVFGFGGSSSYVIYTIVKDKRSGNLAVEHSLSPHYYFNGDRIRARQDVLNFNWNLKGIL